MNDPRSRLAWRAMTSVLIAVAFLVLVLSGIILFLSPPGRIANWTNWTILGLRKHDWIGLHVWFSLLFLVVALAHLVFDWRPMMNHFKDRLTRRVGFRWEWLLALARLEAKGLKAATNLTMREIAVNNGHSRPYELIDIIRGR